MRIQQRSAVDLAAANQKAATVFAKEVVDATISNVKDISDAAIRNSTVH